MIGENMNHMEDVFLNRQLPFAEYIVECGYHPISQRYLKCHPEKESALRDMMDKYGLHFYAKYEIPCEGGAVFNVSVVSGMMFYSRIDAPYEIMGPPEREDDSGDPRGYQTEEDLMVYLAKLVSKAKEY